MNSIHSQNIDELADSKDPARTLKLMEDAATDFLDAKKNNSAPKWRRCERNAADEELTLDDDPSSMRVHPSTMRAQASAMRTNASGHPSRCEQIRAGPAGFLKCSRQCCAASPGSI